MCHWDSSGSLALLTVRYSIMKLDSWYSNVQNENNMIFIIDEFPSIRGNRMHPAVCGTFQKIYLELYPSWIWTFEQLYSIYSLNNLLTGISISTPLSGMSICGMCWRVQGLKIWRFPFVWIKITLLIFQIIDKF